MRFLAVVICGALLLGRAFAQPPATPVADPLSLHGLLVRLEDDGLTPAVQEQWKAVDAAWATGEGTSEDAAAAVLAREIGWVFERNARREDAARLVLPLLAPLGKLPEARQRAVLEQAIAATERARIDRHSLAYISLFPGGARDAMLDWHLANSTVSESLTMDALVEQKLHGTGSEHAEAKLLAMASKYLPPPDKRDLTPFEIQSLFVTALLGNDATRKATRERFQVLAAGLAAADPRGAQLRSADENLSRPVHPRIPKVVTAYQEYRLAQKGDQPPMSFSEFQVKWSAEHSSPADFGIEEAPLPGS